MDSVAAFAKGQAALAAGSPMMVFDWNKAAQLIRDEKPQVASAGLAGDWSYTGGEIYRDGKPVPEDETYTYLGSLWANPELEMDGLRQDCFLLEENSLGWDSGTYWPESALNILKGKAERNA